MLTISAEYFNCRWMVYGMHRSSGKTECNDALRASSSFRQSLEVKEINNGYLAQLNLPGFEKEDVDILLDKGSIKVKATQKQESAQEEMNGTSERSRIHGLYHQR